MYTHLHDLVQTPFFKYFRVDLYRDCPFWQEHGLCMNRECGITTVDEVRCYFALSLHYLTSVQNEIPESWRAAALSKVEMPGKDEVRYRIVAPRDCRLPMS